MHAGVRALTPSERTDTHTHTASPNEAAVPRSPTAELLLSLTGRQQTEESFNMSTIDISVTQFQGKSRPLRLQQRR